MYFCQIFSHQMFRFIFVQMIGSHVGLAHPGQLVGGVLLQAVHWWVNPEPATVIITLSSSRYHVLYISIKFVYLIISAQEPRIFGNEIWMFQEWQQILYVLDHLGLVIFLNFSICDIFVTIGVTPSPLVSTEALSYQYRDTWTSANLLVLQKVPSEGS